MHAEARIRRRTTGTQEVENLEDASPSDKRQLIRWNISRMRKFLPSDTLAEYCLQVEHYPTVKPKLPWFEEDDLGLTGKLLEEVRNSRCPLCLKLFVPAPKVSHIPVESPGHHLGDADRDETSKWGLSPPLRGLVTRKRKKPMIRGGNTNRDFSISTRKKSVVVDVTSENEGDEEEEEPEEEGEGSSSSNRSEIRGEISIGEGVVQFSRSIETEKNHAPTGLRNLGNSCYMNCILQCLSKMPELMSCIENGAAPVPVPRGAEGRVVQELVRILLKLNGSCGSSVISPVALKEAIAKGKAQFANRDQQDSAELLTFLLKCLYDPSKKTTKSKDIAKLFEGQLLSKVRCKNCGVENSQTELFNILTLAVPDSPWNTLEDCIRNYARDEEVERSCHECNDSERAVKRSDFTKVPSALIIHLNRFEKSANQSTRKNKRPVSFPLRGLPLRPDLVREDQGVFDNESRGSYDLRALAVHRGEGIQGGHYLAFSKIPNDRWYIFDDSIVTETSEESVLNETQDSYLLFYERT